MPEKSLQNPQNIIIRLKQVKEITGLPTSTLYAKIAANAFPKQISLGARSVGWIKSEISNWIQEQINTSRTEPTPSESKAGSL